MLQNFQGGPAENSRGVRAKIVRGPEKNSKSKKGPQTPEGQERLERLKQQLWPAIL